MNLGRLAGRRLHPSGVVRQGAPPLLREMPGVASPAQGFQRPTGGRAARSHLQETRSRFLSPSPSRRHIPQRSRHRARGSRTGGGGCRSSRPPEVSFSERPEILVACTVATIIEHATGKAGAVSGRLSSSQGSGRTSRSSGNMWRGGSTYNCTHGIIVRAGVARRGRRLGRLRTAGLFMSAAEEGIKGLGHDVRSARAAISAGPGGMIAGPALRGRHDRGPRGRIEGVTIPLPSLFPQGLTVSNSTQNAGSHKVLYVL